MARVYDDSSNMDEEIEWISEASDYESDQDTPSLPNGNSPIIWEVIKKSADRNFNGNVLDAYIAFVLSYRSFKKDADHQKIMMTVRRYQEGSDAMDFKEALLKAVNKRKHLIKQKVAEVEDSEEDDEFSFILKLSINDVNFLN